ncbi:cytochrome b5 [Deferribacteraceae bacterium V6Fe1]|nr:cytochrome b5 [Deferribacteraceae bacterium V6Fe1]
MRREEVKKFNGKDSQPAYIIYKDKVYDVTNSRFWKNGVHMNRHKAGEDMTDFISMAPHGDDLLKRDNIKYVCDVEPEEIIPDKKDNLRRAYAKYHPHPVFIHYPMGILYFGAFMLLLYIITKNQSFELTAFYSLICGTLSIFPAAASGILSWWLNYEMTMTKIFRNKLILSAVLAVICVFLSITRLLHPDITAFSGLFTLYCLLYFISIPVLTLIAYNGGKITWPN